MGYDPGPLLSQALDEAGITEPLTWVVETILEFERLEQPISFEDFDLEAHKMMYVFMYQHLAEKGEGQE
jgi:hypothetical protein